MLGLFHRWCKFSGNESLYRENFTLDDVTKTLPKYITTGVSEPRAILHIQNSNHSDLKSKYQKNFEKFEFSAFLLEIGNDTLYIISDYQ